MPNSRKEQLAWWALKVYEQSMMYADIQDPKRTKRSAIANKLDTIAAQAKALHFELTGKLPQGVQ
jgi:hypothetical protein